MRIVATSDLHGFQPTFPDGDVLIIAGDILASNSVLEAYCLDAWITSKLIKQFANIILIAGNHDILFEWYNPPPSWLLPVINDKQINYLLDEGVIIDGVKFWGSPYTPRFLDWAFMCDGASIKKHWDKIPTDTNVLITHGPPYNRLDYIEKKKEHAGCPFLRQTIELIMPQMHIFGHIHEGYGVAHWNGTSYYNVSYCNEDYKGVNPPVIIDI